MSLMGPISDEKLAKQKAQGMKFVDRPCPSCGAMVPVQTTAAFNGRSGLLACKCGHESQHSDLVDMSFLDKGVK